ncbi:uncharacterized protein [Solanum tuberosum]|uniref:uncharacterized protein isoform X1 n=1 Tax=Solanum tuberosum TaxID=4113 RepID=UPI00073A3B93|nr:PREDICTED: uncharacterized protein LOC102600143 isoform X1 [Solanum tuberosum]
MPKRRGRACKQSKKISENANQEKHQVEKEDDILSKEEVECQSAAVRAIYNLEIKDIPSLMRLLRSKFNDEQLHIPVVQYFRENLPNLAVVRNEDDTHEVKRKEADGNLSTDQFNGRNLHVSLLRQLSMAYPDCSNAIPSFGEFESSSKSVKTTLFGAENMQIKQFVLEDPSDTQMFELQDTLQTPDVNNNPLSVGMTPKTLRFPKTGEVLLSVHGSPLGVFKEDDTEPIHESEDA